METQNYPLISIIVPVYGVENFLPRCLDSILSQTYDNLQIILVDDGSPDKCPEICDSYGEKDSRIQVIHQKNGGVSNARNTGLQHVEGKYVTFCDSDDCIEMDWILNLVSAIETCGADVVAAGHTKCFPDGSRMKTVHQSAVMHLNCREDQIHYMINWIMNDQLGWEVTTRLFKTEVIRKHGICFCENCGNFSEDLGFVLEYGLYVCTVSSTSDCGYLYFMRENSMMSVSRGNPKLNEVNEVSCFVHRRLKEELAPKLYEKYGPILHFMILREQYQGAIAHSNYHHIGQYVDSIQNFEWWKQETKRIFSCRKELQNLFGKIDAGRILIFSRYLLHRNYFRFKIERFLFFKKMHFKD